MDQSELEALANAARPINDLDWGSDNQIFAENFFFEALEETLGVSLDDDESWQRATYKATIDEIIDHALARIRAHFTKVA